MTTCRKLIDGECTDDAARLEVGEFPSAGVCRVCDRYEGAPRGLGDVIDVATSLLRIKTLVGDCVGCVQRRAALNAAIPFPEKATGGDCGCAKRRAALNAAIPFPDKPKEG